MSLSGKSSYYVCTASLLLGVSPRQLCTRSTFREVFKRFAFVDLGVLRDGDDTLPVLAFLLSMHAYTRHQQSQEAAIYFQLPMSIRPSNNKPQWTR